MVNSCTTSNKFTHNAEFYHFFALKNLVILSIIRTFASEITNKVKQTKNKKNYGK